MHDAAERPAVMALKSAPERPYVVFEDGRDGGRALFFDQPEEIIVDASYELGYALEPKFHTQTTPRSRTPLLLFGAFRAPRTETLPPADAAPRIALTPACTESEYAERVRQCRDYIFAGDVYQINLTFPLHGRYDGDPLTLYRGLRKRQPVAYGGVVALGEETVVSLSPRAADEGHGAARRDADRGYGARAISDRR